MKSKLLTYITAIVLIIPAYVLAQGSTTAFDVTTARDPSSKIKGPLVTLEKDSFASALAVLLQSLYYNNNILILDDHTETATVLGVDLIAEFKGTLTIDAASIEPYYSWTDGKIIDVSMDLPAVVVNKTYTIRSAHDPDYSSTGFVALSAVGMNLFAYMDSNQLPYFVNSVHRTVPGNITTTIKGEGIPLADEIQETLQDLVKNQFDSVDVVGFANDAYDKISDMFNKNQLILCYSCEVSYCQC